MGLASVSQTALSGISAAMLQVETVANNLANAQTPGFKAAAVQLETQGERQGVSVAGTATDFSQGAIAPGEALPLLALEGEGLFILESRDGRRVYTRDGSFSLNADGELVNSLGDRLLGHALNEDGILDRTQLSLLNVRLGTAVATPDGATAKLIGYSVQRDGRLVGKYSDGIQRTLGQLRLARFHNPFGLEQRGGNLYRATPASGLPLEADPETDGAAAVIGGARELSNTDIGEQLIQLSLARTQFLANLAVLEASDSMLLDLMQLGPR